MPGAALIGVDWETTSFRAYLIAEDGRILDRRSGASGILQVPDRDFAGVLEQQVRPWHAAARSAPIILSGMITSRQGWQETPYLACPAGAADLAAALERRETGLGRVHLVAGLRTEDAEGVPDVIRGEETQIAGLALDHERDLRVVLPGTHSKWADVRGGRIAGFQTYMTGEVYGVLREQSILGRLMTGERHDPAAFARGLDAAGPGGRGLLRRLFSARTLGLFDRLPGEAIGSYLSGLLIGTEIAEALADGRSADPLVVVGESALAGRYLEAFRHVGVAAEPAPDDLAARGHLLIARHAGLVG